LHAHFALLPFYLGGNNKLRNFRKGYLFTMGSLDQRKSVALGINPIIKQNERKYDGIDEFVTIRG